MFHSLRSHLLCSTNQAALTSLLSGAELLLSVDLNTTPLCRVPDAHIYVDEYLCTDKEEQDFPTDGGNTTSRPKLVSGSPSLGVSFAITTPLWTRPTRDPMEGVPPNRCTWVKQFSKGVLWWECQHLGVCELGWNRFLSVSTKEVLFFFELEILSSQPCWVALCQWRAKNIGSWCVWYDGTSASLVHDVTDTDHWVQTGSIHSHFVTYIHCFLTGRRGNQVNNVSLYIAFILFLTAVPVILFGGNQVKHLRVYVVFIPFHSIPDTSDSRAHGAFWAQFPFNVVGRSCEWVRFPKHKFQIGKWAAGD